LPLANPSRSGRTFAQIAPADLDIPVVSQLTPGAVSAPRGLDRDAPKLLDIPAAVHGLSIEPQLAPVRLGRFVRRLQSVINGGESGAEARPFHLEWARSLIAECRSAGTAIYMQKLGCNPFVGGRRLRLSGYAGGDWNEWPIDLRIRQFPIA
jgi:protein gp37